MWKRSMWVYYPTGDYNKLSQKGKDIINYDDFNNLYRALQKRYLQYNVSITILDSYSSNKIKTYGLIYQELKAYRPIVVTLGGPEVYPYYGTLAAMCRYLNIPCVTFTKALSSNCVFSHTPTSKTLVV